jgi:hypothetical protein
VQTLTYTVPVGDYIRVTLKNLSDNPFDFECSYQEKTSEELDHGYLSAHLVKDGECDFPYLKKEAEEAEDFWHVLDNEGKTILLLKFCVKN